jgi:hypothetical protein
MSGEARPIECCGACPPILGGGYDCTCVYVERCPQRRVRLVETASATCGSCHWSASGPWSHLAAYEHHVESDHEVAVHGPIGASA